MSQRSRFYPRVQVDTAPVAAVGQAGGVLLTETVAASGLDADLARQLSAWFKPLAIHHPGKVLLDLALTLAVGGDCLADVALLRAEPQVYGLIASDATISRTIDALAADAPTVLAAINTARASARERVWARAGVHAPDHRASAAAPVVIDLDATLITAHSDKEHAARPTSAASVTTRCGRSPIMGRPAPVNHYRSSSGQGTPDRTPPSTTSRSPKPHSRSCLVTGPGNVLVGGC